MSGYDDEMLARAGHIGPDEYYDFDLERVLPLPSESAFREQGIRDGRAQKLRTSQHPAYTRGYELGEELRKRHAH